MQTAVTGEAGDVRGASDVSDELVATVVRLVDESRDGLVEFVQELLSFRTESPNPAASHYPAEADACRARLRQFLDGHGFEITEWDARAHIFPRHPLIVGRLAGSGGGRSIALNGHFDVVDAGDHATWSRDPWGRDVVDGRIYGRGAVDMKGGIGAMLWAVRILERAGVKLKGDVWAHLVGDEEVVGWGSRECVERLPRVDAVLSTEPSHMSIMPVTGGLEQMRIEVEGRMAHSGVRYLSTHAGGHEAGGVNAIEKMVKILVAIQELERIWGNTRSHPLLPSGFNTLLPGIFIGGNGGGHDGMLNMLTNPSSAPDYASLEYNVWYYPGERLEDVKREIEEYAGHVCAMDPWLREHPPRFTWNLRNISFPPVATDVNDPIVTTMAEMADRVGIPVKVEGATYVTDLSWYADAGMAGVIFAPGSIRQAHAPDEYVEIDKLQDAVKAIALALVGFCGRA